LNSNSFFCFIFHFIYMNIWQNSTVFLKRMNGLKVRFIHLYPLLCSAIFLSYFENHSLVVSVICHHFDQFSEKSSMLHLLVFQSMPPHKRNLHKDLILDGNMPPPA